MKQTGILLFLLVPFLVSAQAKIMKGRITDAVTHEGIAYTNIGIEGTYYGCASDAEGLFELNVPEEFSKGKLFISAVGYQHVTLLLPDLLEKEFVEISLTGQTYQIAGVDVEASSRVPFRILRTASLRVPENYQAGPFGLRFYYQEEKMVNDSNVQQREGIVDLYDQHGYSSPSVTDAYESRRYQFLQVKKNFDSRSFSSGHTGFEELIEMDVVRMTNTILNEELLDGYELKLGKTVNEDGDSVWVISYRANKPDLVHCGDYYATRMDGKIYILMSNYAVIRNECVIRSHRNNGRNRSLFSADPEQRQVRYHFTSTYLNHKGRYLVNQIDCEKNYLDQQGREVVCSRNANALHILWEPKELAGRDYFENTPYRENFWQDFKRPE